MKQRTLCLLAGVCLMALGCTEKQRVPEQPPAVSKAAETPRYVPPVSRVDSEDITSENYKEFYSKLEKDIELDKRASARLPNK